MLVQSDYNSATRELTITVEAYYTAASTAPFNLLNLVLIQDSVVGQQQVGAVLNPTYNHMHMLRYMITGQWGDTITNTAQGALFTRTYNYTVPVNYGTLPCVVEHCHIAAFVTQTQQEILNGDVVYAVGGTNKFIGTLTAPVPGIVAGSSGNTTAVTASALAAITATEDYEYTLESTNLPADWTASFTVDGTTYTSTATISMNPAIAKSIIINVTPGTTPKVAELVLKMHSLVTPSAPDKQIKVYVIANVTDLVVNGSGGSETWTYESNYLAGLAYAGNTHNTSASATILKSGITSGAFADVNNIYLNIGWTFPALKNDEATALMQFMDNGGNVMIGGQDIGWDIMSGASGSNGTPVTQDFYTHYLHASWVDDGTSANNQLNAVTADPIFGNVGNSAIVCPYGTNNYPDQLNPVAGGVAIYTYNTAAKIAAVRSMTASYKTVYFGIGMEMVGNTAIRDEIVKRTHDWFYSLVSAEEFGNSLLELAGQPYPNPCNSELSVPVKENNGNLQLTLRDISGRVIYSELPGSGNTNLKINTGNFDNGLYFLEIVKDGRVLSTKKIEVIH